MTGSDLTPRGEDDEYAGFARGRSRRMRLTAWVAIVALILVGGGSTVFALLFG
ncbi:hypothetical protein [Microbacterium oleivorans]|uniref:Uncharacterized protein n=1 Tax=Microbacterium oleivorans TaxID=273677 RepID=A0A7D5EVZ0_9MICO|nr:hypothetical protein [Microbacterium oleivorans]QLD10308.1 hypothetical protein HW566_08570 [Microbacterium oleivorans]